VNWSHIVKCCSEARRSRLGLEMETTKARLNTLTLAVKIALARMKPGLIGFYE